MTIFDAIKKVSFNKEGYSGVVDKMHLKEVEKLMRRAYRDSGQDPVLGYVQFLTDFVLVWKRAKGYIQRSYHAIGMANRKIQRFYNYLQKVEQWTEITGKINIRALSIEHREYLVFLYVVGEKRRAEQLEEKYKALRIKAQWIEIKEKLPPVTKLHTIQGSC